MLEQEATVIEAGQHRLLVETIARSSCAHCSSNQCSTSVIAGLFGLRRNLLQIENTLQAKPGDQVMIGIPDRVLVRASLWAYLLPLVTMLAAAITALALGLGSSSQALFALAGLVSGLVCVNRATRSRQRRRSFDPVLLRVIGRQGITVELSGFNSPGTVSDRI